MVRHELITTPSASRSTAQCRVEPVRLEPGDALAHRIMSKVGMLFSRDCAIEGNAR